MALVSLHTFRTQPGRLADHIAASDEARRILQGLGLQAFTMQPITGTDVGTISLVINHADSTEWAASFAKVQADPGWQAFSARVTSDTIAEQVESSIFTDLDATFSPAPDRPLGALQITQWRPRHGRMVDLIGNVTGAQAHLERLGGTGRSMSSLVGAHPMTVVVSVSYPDLEHLAEATDKLAVDEQWQAFWAGVMADPSADLIRSGIYVTTLT
jgi:hypothetical protein